MSKNSPKTTKPKPKKDAKKLAKKRAKAEVTADLAALELIAESQEHALAVSITAVSKVREHDEGMARFIAGGNHSPEVEQVETEKGREFQAGFTPAYPAPRFAEPGPVLERDHFGRPKITRPDGTTKNYTRVTTYIDCLDDKTALERWKMRTVMEGAALDLEPYLGDGELDAQDSLIASARKISVAYDKTLAKIVKRELRGELDLGQFGLLRAEAKKIHDDDLNALASRALDLGGAHDAATKGTDLHKLCERYDLGELDIDAELEAGTILPADAADVRAYAAKMTELGIEHFQIERLVVIDELGIAGTLDRASLYKFPGTARRVRVVADLKTGKIEYAPGKIGLQLRAYALGKGYDPANPTAREDLKLSRTKGLLIHLPAGEARCTVYAVDLDLAAKGLMLARDVRTWRNEGKAVYNLAQPLTPIKGTK